MHLTHSSFVSERVTGEVWLLTSLEPDMLTFGSWRVLVAMLGFLAVACTNSALRPDSGGVPDDSSQPRTERGGAGGGRGY